MRRINELEEKENLMQSDSNDVQARIVMGDDLRNDRYKTAIPPPGPSVRGLCSSEKLSGVIAFSVEIGVSVVNQVSVSEMISSDSSQMNSCRTVGLSRVLVTEQAERTFRQAKEREVKEFFGPGLSSTSPQTSNRK